MTHMQRIGIIGITIVLFLLPGCIPHPWRTAPWYLPEEKYVFIEYRVEEDGRVLEGEYPTGPMVDFPTYMFDPDRGTLVSREFNFAIDDTLKVIVGKSMALRGVAGGGISSSLSAAYSLPYDADPLSITKIEADGTAHVRFQAERLLIKSGDEWSVSATRRDTIGVGRSRSVAEFTKTHRIVNRGIFEKENIRTW